MASSCLQKFLPAPLFPFKKFNLPKKSSPPPCGIIINAAFHPKKGNKQLFCKNYWFTSSVVIYSCTPIIPVHVLKCPMKNISTEYKTGGLFSGQIIRIWKDNKVKIVQSTVYAPLTCPYCVQQLQPRSISCAKITTHVTLNL